MNAPAASNEANLTMGPQAAAPAEAGAVDPLVSSPPDVARAEAAVPPFNAQAVSESWALQPNPLHTSVGGLEAEPSSAPQLVPPMAESSAMPSMEGVSLQKMPPASAAAEPAALPPSATGDMGAIRAAQPTSAAVGEGAAGVFVTPHEAGNAPAANAFPELPAVPVVPVGGQGTAASVQGGHSATSGGLSRWAMAALLLAGVSALTSLTLWQRLSTVQEQLARQNLDASNQAYRASTLAQQSQEQVGDVSTRIAMLEGRVMELAAQRQQIDALLQAASRSVDDSLLADLESSLRMAQEQAQLTGSASPLLAALQSAQRRLANSTVPGVARVQRAMASDVSRIKSAPRTDVSMSLAQMDELIRQVDQLPAWQEQSRTARAAHPAASEEAAQPALSEVSWQAVLASAWAEVRGLVRVQSIDLPQGALLSSDQVRQLRLVMHQRLLSARMGLLARQPEAVRADLVAVSELLGRHFDPGARQSQRMQQDIDALRSSVAEFQLPRIDDSLTTLAQVLGAGG